MLAPYGGLTGDALQPLRSLALAWLSPDHVAIAGGLFGWVVLWFLTRRRRTRGPRSRVRSRQEEAQQRAGQVGESLTTRVFNHRLPHAQVWPDVHVAYGYRTSQCDHIVYGAFGLVVVETKHWTGTLSRVNADHWLQANASGAFKLYESPESQNAYHGRVVAAVLRRHGLGSIPVYGAIVLSNPRAQFISEAGHKPIGTPEYIAEWIQRVTSSGPITERRACGNCAATVRSWDSTRHALGIVPTAAFG